MIIDDLEKIGFTKIESKIFLYLNNSGKSSASTISKNIGINRTSTYDSLNRLISKGFVSYILKGKVKIFISSSPQIILKYYQEQEQKAQEILEKLSKTQKQEEELVEIYEGKKGIKTILYDILNYKSYVAFGSSGKFYEVMGPDFIAFQNRKKELKIKSKVLQTTINSKLKKIAFAKFKIIPQEFSSPITTIIYANRVALIIWGINPCAILILSSKVSNQFLKQFELLWEIGKSK